MRYPAQSDLWRLNYLNGQLKNGLSKANTPTILDHGESKRLGYFRQVFPLTLFPDDLIVEELRIIHFKRSDFWSREVISIMATDIACVNANTGLLFGEVIIQSLTGGRDIDIKHLVRRDVFKIRSLVEGIALSAREGLVIENRGIEEEKEALIKAGSFSR